jgi:hypothetical protein
VKLQLFVVVEVVDVMCGLWGAGFGAPASRRAAANDQLMQRLKLTKPGGKERKPPSTAKPPLAKAPTPTDAEVGAPDSPTRSHPSGLGSETQTHASLPSVV